jgi:hypothetical protein
MRMYSLLAVFVLVTPAIYAQHSPTAAPTPAPPPPSHTTTSSPAPASSSSSSSSSSGGGAIHSSPPSTTSSSPSSSPGAGSGSWNRHDRDSSRDSVSTSGRGNGSSPASSSPAKHSDRDSSSPALDTKTDTSRSRHHDPDPDKTRGRQDPPIGSGHEKDIAAGKVTDLPPVRGEQTKIAKVPGDPSTRKCDKEPCPSPTPQLSHTDWRRGRCDDGPCEPCPSGSSPNKYGNCVAHATPPACAPGTVWNGAGCARPAAAPAYPAATTASAPQCIYYFSQSTQRSTDLTIAREKVREACSNDPASAECSFAKIAEIQARQSCLILQNETPSQCQASITNCF